MRHIYLLLLAALLVSCGQKKANNAWINENEVHVAIDASFEPLMNGEIAAFCAKHIEAEIHPIFTSEDSVLRLLKMDSVRCAIATRKLTKDEIEYIRTKHRLVVNQYIVAYDAFALIVNKANTDTIITVPELRKIVTGQITRWEQLEHARGKGDLSLVFDQSGSSTVRYMRDSLCNGKELTGPIFAQGSSLEVIEAVRNRRDVIGVVSTDWLRGSDEGAKSSFRDLDVNVMLVSEGRSAYDMSRVCRPYQYYIATGEYPLVRSVYVISTDPRPQSMLKNFYFFLKGDSGQRIICNDSQLLPHLGVQVRDVKMKN